MVKKVLLALGGNAILSDDASAEGQQKAIRQTANQLVDLVAQGHQLIISHGNGPQVGNLLLQQASADSDSNPAMPLDTCVAMTQGSIGYWLQQELRAALKDHNLDHPVVSLVSQVVVDPEDPAFSQPTKPIGPFLSEAEAQEAQAESGHQFVEDAGRGYRRVVASPKPIDIIEADVIQTLVDQGVITISAGGGGIPVVKEGDTFRGVEAVIDKDLASAKLGQLLGVDSLIILTGVDHVYLNFNQPNQEKLEEVTLDQVKEWKEDGHFAPGSMLPKIEAAIDFLDQVDQGQVVITSLDNLSNYLQGGSATVIRPS